MDTQALAAVTAALGLVAFERTGDGDFAPLGPSPDWFAAVTAGETFPFLGHILEEATAFWQRGTPGRADWGPVAEVDGHGREYHYTVSALAADGRHYLVFQLDAGAERMREVLQRVRSEALSAEQDHASHRIVATELHRLSDDVKLAIAQLMRTAPTPVQSELLTDLTQKTLALTNGIGRLIQSTTVPRV
ncbi:MAG: hypothetical protein AB7H96_19650 [Vicinamibacterales bacterium]